MKKILMFLTLLSTALLLTGCATATKGLPWNKGSTEYLTKSFFNRTIVYKMECQKTQAIMSRMESLQRQKFDDMEKEVTEKDVIKLYRDADTTRDHLVTLIEAQSIENEYSLSFEDGLGYLE